MIFPPARPISRWPCVDLLRFLRQRRSIDWEWISMRTGGNNRQLWRRTVGGSEWIATLMHFPLPCNLHTSISRTISPPPPVLMERFLFNCHIITIIIRAVNKRQGRRQTCHINQGITSAEYHHPSLPPPPPPQQGMLGAHEEGPVDINGGSVRSASISTLIRQ